MWDPISIVEAAYDVNHSEKLWLERLADRIAPQLPAEMGVMGLLFDRQAPAESLIRECVAKGASTGSSTSARAQSSRAASGRGRERRRPLGIARVPSYADHVIAMVMLAFL